MSVVLRKIGNSLGVILPQEILDRYGIKEGDEINLEARDGGIALTPVDDEFTEQVELGRKFMDKYKTALQKLGE